MANIDKKQRAKDSIINTIVRTVEKTVSQSNFTKTILATIQYCADKVNGQYKIKYQNGYFTAFAQNVTSEYIYSEGSLVYVLVPNGDFTGRLLIIGSASNTNGDKIYLTNLTDDQKYKAIGSNLLIKNGNLDLNLSSYWCGQGADEEFIKYYYENDGTTEDTSMFTLNQTTIDNIKHTKFFRLGARFQTSFTDDRKSSGDYGIKIVAVFRKDDGSLEEKEYILNTFIMNGTPFEFTDPMPQYCIWELTNPNKFIRIKSIGGFVCNFPDSSISDPPIDIKITDLSIYAAEQLYDTTNDVYRVQIDSPDKGFTFKNSSTVDLLARFYIRSEEMQSDAFNDLEFYWGKKDCQIDSVANPRYNEVLGKGWYCLNLCTLKSSDDPDISTLKQNSTNTISPGEDITYNRSDLTYYVNIPSLLLPITVCQGKETTIKCAIKYGGNYYYSEETIVYNPNGYYVLAGALDNKKTSQNGVGYFTIAAGIFKDEIGEDVPDNSLTLDESRVSYKWVQIKDGVRKDVPPVNRSDIAQLLLNIEGWSSTEDNETMDYTDPMDNEFLAEHPELILCLDRYNYYNQKRNNEDLSSEEQERCDTRSKNIINGRVAEIQSYYQSGYENKSGYYITGPSEVTGKYLADGQREDSVNAVVDIITPQFDEDIEVFNTLYQIPAYVVNTVATYEVSAVVDGIDIGSAEVTLVNEVGNAFDYSVDIVNGIQTYVYDERGIAPTADAATQQIIASPLSFIIYNKERQKLYESIAPDSYPDIDIGELKPIWRFVDAEYSLLSTNYQKPDGTPTIEGGKYAYKSSDFETNHLWELKNEAQFYYMLQDNYDPANINNSNIELELVYNGQSIFATTLFTFSKQGELGTNGTNRALTIYSPPYTNNYKESVLSAPKYCYFNPRKTPAPDVEDFFDTARRYYGPNARHLKNPYMFATNNYATLTPDVNDNLVPCSIDDGHYVNLSLAQAPYGNNGDIVESSTADYQAIWSNKPNETPSNTANFEWSIEEARDIEESNTSQINSTNFHYFNVFRIEGTAASSAATIALNRVDDVPSLSKKPIYEDGNNKYYANNILKASADMTINNRVIKNHSFCTIPYYYINWTYRNGGGEMPANVDPAQHIVIIGGFDQVMYDSTGRNPSYNSQNPFQFYMFDKDGKNITYSVIKAAIDHNQRDHATTSIQWDCSPGLQIRYKGVDAINGVETFDNLSDNMIGPGTLCSNGTDAAGNKIYYKCIKTHRKNDSNNVSNGDGTRTTYPAGSFVPPYWTEIDPISYSQTMEVAPAPTFESMVESNLFNSWVRVRIKYKIYEAEAIIPINIYCNSYESPELNGWDGKTLTLEDGEDQSYLIANKVSAGVKDENNRFIGISIGENIRYEAQSNNRPSKKVSAVGLFGFGQGYDETGRTQQTLFLDAKTGLAAFGPSGGSQIVLNPNPTKWSRLAGWYFSKDLLYKPIGGSGTIENQAAYQKIMSGEDLELPSGSTKSFGIYVPSVDAVTSDTVAIWAGDQVLSGINAKPSKSGQFYLTYGGLLHAENVDIAGNIVANSGKFGTDTDTILINSNENNHTYVLKHKDFWVETESTATETGDQSKKTTVGIRGKIMAESGQIGSTRSNLDGNTRNAVFLYYKWYPWKLPAINEPFDNQHYYLDTEAGTNTTYLLYHPNFSITRGGDVRVDGKLFVRNQSRIGKWAVNNSGIQSYDYDSVNHVGIKLEPDGDADFGQFYIKKTGEIGSRQDTTDTQGSSIKSWWISSNGIAHFNNASNTFRGSSYIIGSTGSFDEHGLHIPPGGEMTIGDAGASLHAFEGGGFEFTGPGMSWNLTTAMRLNNGITISGSNHSVFIEQGYVGLSSYGLSMGSGYGGTAIYHFNTSGEVLMNNIKNQDQTFIVSGTGDTTVHNLTINGSLTFNGLSLEQYIKNIVRQGLSVGRFPPVTVMKSDGTTATIYSATGFIV